MLVKRRIQLDVEKTPNGIYHRSEDVEIEVKEEKFTVEKLKEILKKYNTIEEWVERFGEHKEIYKWENIDNDVKDYILGFGDFIPVELEKITTVDKKKINNYRYGKSFGATKTDLFRSLCFQNNICADDVESILFALKKFIEEFDEQSRNLFS